MVVLHSLEELGVDLILALDDVLKQLRESTGTFAIVKWFSSVSSKTTTYSPAVCKTTDAI